MGEEYPSRKKIMVRKKVYRGLFELSYWRNGKRKTKSSVSLIKHRVQFEMDFLEKQISYSIYSRKYTNIKASISDTQGQMYQQLQKYMKRYVLASIKLIESRVHKLL